MRLFVALPLPEPVKAAVAQVQRELKSAVRSAAVRWTPPEQIHLTLRFLGDVAASVLPELENALSRACRGVSPLELTACGAGAFPDDARPRVLWIGLSGQLDRLGSLQARIENETAPWGQREERDFHPHLTLARIKDARPVDVRPIAQALSRLHARHLSSWHVGEVELMRSELTQYGAKHSTLITIPFRRDP